MNMTDFGKKCIAQVSLLGCLDSCIGTLRGVKGEGYYTSLNRPFSTFIKSL